jgi:hypothetical protein
LIEKPWDMASIEYVEIYTIPQGEFEWRAFSLLAFKTRHRGCLAFFIIPTSGVGAPHQQHFGDVAYSCLSLLMRCPNNVFPCVACW